MNDKMTMIFFDERSGLLGQLLHHIIFCSDLLFFFDKGGVLSAALTDNARAVYLCLYASLDDLVKFINLVGEEYSDDGWLLNRNHMVNVMRAQAIPKK